MRGLRTLAPEPAVRCGDVPRCAAASNTKRARVTQTARATRFPASYLGLGGVLQELHLHRLQLLLVRSELNPLLVHCSSSRLLSSFPSGSSLSPAAGGSARWR